jgi:hypothetical protein
VIGRQRSRGPWRSLRPAVLAVCTVLAILGVDHVRQPAVLAWENALPTVAEPQRACWPASSATCWEAAAADRLPSLRVSAGEMVELLVARTFPVPPRTIAVTIRPLDGDGHDTLTFSDDGYMILTPAPAQPGAYLMHVEAQWDGTGLVESALRLDVRAP